MANTPTPQAELVTTSKTTTEKEEKTPFSSEKNAQAMSILISSVEDGLLHDLRDATTAADVWTHLSRFEKVEQPVLLSMKRRLLTISYDKDGEEGIEEYLAAITKLAES